MTHAILVTIAGDGSPRQNDWLVGTTSYANGAASNSMGQKEFQRGYNRTLKLRYWAWAVTYSACLLFGLAVPIHAATVKSASCLPNKGEPSATCLINLAGIVEPDDVLLVTKVSDVDITSFMGRELGRTGYLFGGLMYAQMLPRTYSLESLAGIDSPTITMQCRLINKITFRPTVGLDPLTSTVKIISEKHALLVWVKFFAYHLFVLIIMLTAVALALGQLQSPILDGWSWRRGTTAIFFISAGAYEASLSRLPRLLTPWLIPVDYYSALHSAIGTLTVLMLTELIRTSTFSNPAEATVGEVRYPMLERVAFVLTWSTGLVSFCLSWLSLNPGYYPYIYTLLAQSLVCAFVLSVKLINVRKAGLENSLLSGKVFAAALALSCVMLIRDSIVLAFFYTPGTSYLIVYGQIITALAWVARGMEYRTVRTAADDLCSDIRVRLQTCDSANAKLSALCTSIQKFFDVASVSVFSIRDANLLVLASSSHNVSLSATSIEIDPNHEAVLKSGKPLHFIKGNIVSETSVVGSTQSNTFLIPILRKQDAVGGIVVHPKQVQLLTSKQILTLRHCANVLGLEGLAALTDAITELQFNQISGLVRSTSGIALEHVDAWGRLKLPDKPERRVIITADGIKSTHIDQMGYSSERLWSMHRAYKQELYSIWFAAREVFELVTRDVRGDDFWLLSPRRFQNKFLAGLGAERVAIIAASFIEEQCRNIAKNVKYAALGRSGAHVAVGADDIEIIEIGTNETVSRDIHGRGISRLTRIRGAANPGAILVDFDDPFLNSAANDTTLFRTTSIPRDLEDYPFKDLHEVPNVGCILGTIDSEEIVALKTEALSRATQSSYSDKGSEK